MTAAGELLTVDQVAERLGCRRWHVDELIRSGQLAATDIGANPAAANHRPTWRVEPADLAAFLAARRTVRPERPKRPARRPEPAEVTRYY